MERRDVVIVGGGPAGLGAAARLARCGRHDIVVLEREAEAGGVPRHCGHWGFGFESHRRLMHGPCFAEQLRHDAGGVEIRTSTTVLQFLSANVLLVQDAQGVHEIEAKRIIIATGARESSRAARLIGGNRIAGVMNTGTLQQMVYLNGMKPFSSPVILGGEWVSFSALMTCKHAGIKPVAMIVEEPHLDAPWFFATGARLVYGVDVHLAARPIAIQGMREVEAVEVEQAGMHRSIECDGVIVSGRFVPEDTLFACGPLSALKSGDPNGSPDHVALAGNVHGALKTAGRCVVEARALAERLAGVIA